MANKKNVIKLDEQYFEITEDENGHLHGKPLNNDGLFEVSVFEEGIEKLLDNDMAKLAKEAYEEIKKSFKSNLKKTVLKTLGFENDYGEGWKVDHCNGRMSEVTNYLSQKVKSMFHSEVDPVIADMMPTLMKDVQKEIKKEFKELFLRETRNEARRRAKIAAQGFLEQLMTKEVQKLQKKAIAEIESSFLGRTRTPVEPNNAPDLLNYKKL